MANDLNRCEFIGRLGRDVETRYMPSGGAVSNFPLAVGEQWKDKNTGEKQESTEWIPIVAFNRLGEICGEYLKKGSKVFVAGKFKTRKWQGQDGEDKYKTEVVINEMQMLDGRGGAAGTTGDTGGRQGADSGQPSPQAAPGGDDFDDDIPFSQIRHTHLV